MRAHRLIPLQITLFIAAGGALLALVAPSQARKSPGRNEIKVMSYNIFQGSELSHTLTATSGSALPAAVAADYGNVIASNIPARAAALAAEIKANSADLVGLQEAVEWRTQTPPNKGLVTLVPTASTVSYDFVALLVKALGKLGLHYTAVAITNNLDIQATGSFASGPMDVRFTDRVAILARKGVKITNVVHQNFKTHDSVPLFGFPLTVPDGYASVDATIGARRVRFITTHLDGLNDSNASSIRNAEMKEILAGSGKTSLPVVITCDCNAIPTSLLHHTVIGAGLRDAWSVVNGHNAGLTCCHRNSPTNPEVDVADPSPTQGIVERLDYVWAGKQFTVMSDKTVGLNPADRTKTTPKLWPSDHLGLAAVLSLP